MKHYEIRLLPAARRAITHELPEQVAAAAIEFIGGPLAENPHRVGKQLRGELYPRYSARRGSYRVIYLIFDTTPVVEVITVLHRRDAYR